MTISLTLLGAFRLQAAAGRTAVTLRRKTRALLAYLVVTQSAHTRQALADLFCPQAAVPGRALRLMLSRLRRAVGPDVLLTIGELVRIEPSSLWIDVTRFSQVLAGDLNRCPMTDLQAALDLYQGEFLAGLQLPDAAGFELWLLGTRARLNQQYERGLLALLQRQMAQAQWGEATRTAQKLVHHNPVLEEAHHHLIWLYAQTGQRGAALAQFDQCRTILQQELAVGPSPDLLTLHADILNGRLPPPLAAGSSPVSLPQLPASAADFVGRNDELAKGWQLWQEVVAGNGRSLIITAPAGGGKTRFVHELAPTLPDAHFLSGNCYETARTLAYQPWIQLLEAYLAQCGPDALAQLPSHWQGELTRLLPQLSLKQEGAVTEGSQEQLFAAVVALLQQAERPLLLFLDDLQWADEASLQLFHFVLERLKKAPLLLLGTYRTEEAEDNPALLTLLADLSRRTDSLKVTLEPLPASALGSLMAQLWPKLPPGYRTPHLQETIRQATGGNPLFAIEMMRELAGLTHIPDELPVPPSLRDLITRRLGQLPASSRQVLESLAILDQPLYFNLAQQISGRSENETLQALEQGLRWRLLEAGTETVDFSHDLMRQGIQEQLTPVRRQLLHRRTAVALEQQGAQASTLAYHWGQAGETEPERRYAIQAGHDAAALYAYQEAIRYYQRALALTSDRMAQASLHHRLGRAWKILGDWEKAETAFEAGLALTGAQASLIQAELQVAYGTLLEHKGEYAAALAQEELALAYFRATDDRPRIARTLGLIAQVYGLQGRYEEAITTCQQALTDPDALTDPTVHIRLLNTCGAIFWRQRAYETALDYLQRAYKLVQQTHDLKYEALVLRSLGNVLQELGRYDQAITYYRQCLAISQTMQDKKGLAMDWTNLALICFFKGDDETALQYGHRALQMVRELGGKGGEALLLGNLANSLIRLERYEEAFAYCRQGLEIDAGIGNRRGMLIHAGNMSTIYLHWGLAAEALACLAYALSLDDRLEHTPELAFHLTTITAVYLFENQLAQAEEVLQAAMPLQKELAIDFELCWAFLVQGRLFLAQERFAAAVDALNQAIQSARASRRADIQFEAEVLLPRAQWLAEQNETAVARQHLQTMLENQPGLRQQAAIYYELWRLDDHADSLARARTAYEILLKQSPTVAARRQALELGAANLPPEMDAPPLPPFITDTPLDLDSLLKKVKQNLSNA